MKNSKHFQYTPIQVRRIPLYYHAPGWSPSNPEEAKKVKKWVVKFTMLNDKLYKRVFSQPYLKCVEEKEAKYILKEVY